MHISVLGPIELSDADHCIRLAGEKQRALLAALTLEHGKVVPAGRLIDILWDVNPPATARAKIHAHVSALRQAMDQRGNAHDQLVLTRPPGYLLRCEGVELDLGQYESLSSRGREMAAAAEPAIASGLFAKALALWRGNAYADVRSPVIRTAAAALEERRILVVEAKAESDLALGRCDSVVAELAKWLAAHPFRERLRGLMMLALYRLGCRADALSLYRDGYRAMVAELGLEPGPQLRSLHQRILADDPALINRT